MSEPISDLYAVIPAGGAGTRLWPMSRRSHPKFLLDVLGSGRTLIQGPWDRLVGLTGPDQILVVTGRNHEVAVAEQLEGLAARNLVCEPSPRDSMAAIGLAAALLEHRHGPVLMASFAADHVVPDPDLFADAVRSAAAAARAGYVATIGITPAHPSTAFGYIRSGLALGEEHQVAGGPVAHVAAEFVEKPDEETATAYLAAGGFAWNAGMFVVRTDVLLGHLARLQPPLEAGLRAIAQAWDTPERDAIASEVWPGLTKIAIDHAIAEPVAATGGVAVVPGSFRWDDVGDWDSLAQLLAADEGGVRSVGGPADVVTIDAPGLTVSGDDHRVLAVVGLSDVVVVRTPDAILVTDRDHAQQVKAVVDELAARGRTELL